MGMEERVKCLSFSVNFPWNFEDFWVTRSKRN